MRQLFGLGLALATGLVSTTALAKEEAAPTVEVSSDDGFGLSLGLRAGFALPLGEVSKDSSMSDSFHGAIPFQLDALYRVTPNIGVGLYLSYGMVMPNKDNLPSGADASGSWLKYGVQARYRLSPEATSTPWFGLGIGMESVTTTVSGNGRSVDTSLSGLEFARIMAGYDFAVANEFSVGPFVDFSLGQYSSMEVAGVSADIEKSMHQWLFLGVHGNYDL